VPQSEAQRLRWVKTKSNKIYWDQIGSNGAGSNQVKSGRIKLGSVKFGRIKFRRIKSRAAGSAGVRPGSGQASAAGSVCGHAAARLRPIPAAARGKASPVGSPAPPAAFAGTKKPRRSGAGRQGGRLG